MVVPQHSAEALAAVDDSLPERWLQANPERRWDIADQRKRGRRAKTAPLTSPVTSYGYTGSGDLHWMSDPRGYVTVYAHDYLHRMTRESKDNGGIQAKTRYFYDTLGNLSLVQDPEGRNTTYEYDGLHRTTKKTVDPINWDPGTGSIVLNAAGLNDAWTYQYDAFSNQKRVTDPLGHYTSYNYDYLNRLKETTLYNGADTDYAYDNRGNLASVTDPTNNTTSYTYDYLHRRRSEQTSYGTESYLYDLAGNMIWKEDRLDQITRYDRDGLGRTWRERWKNSAGTTIRTMTYGFDDFSRLTGVTDPSANYTYVYDALSRVTQVTHDPDGLTPNVVVDQAYDAAGNRTQMKAAVASMNDFVNDYTFDALNRITVITQGEQTIGNPVAAKRANLAYDASDRLTYVWRYSSLDTSEYVGRVKYISYDKAGRLTDMKYDGGGIATIDYDIRYADHLLDYVTITTSAVTINYNYDSVDQVNNIDYTGTGMPADVTYGYDDSGNRTNTGYSTGTFNRLTSDGTYNYTYDANGNRTLRTRISDNTKTEYTWDHRNRLTGVKFKTSAGTLTKEIQYFYDVYNRLVRRRIDADGAGAGGFTDTFWAYDGDSPILEFASGTATAPSHRYLWGPAVDQILADEQVATGSPDDVRWPMTDWQGTVRDVATYNASTNVTTIANHKVYEAFGKVYSESGPTVDTIFGYTGRYFDDDAGLQWNLNRWYDPGVGRWLSEDPIGFAGGDPNLYRYVGNSVGAYTDPNGLENPAHMVEQLQNQYNELMASTDPGAREYAIQVRNEMERWRELVTGEFPAHELRAIDATVRFNNPLTHVGSALARSNVGTTLRLMDRPRQAVFCGIENSTSITRDEIAGGIGCLVATRREDGGAGYNPTCDPNMWVYRFIVDQTFDPTNYIGAGALKGVLGRSGRGASKFGMLDDCVSSTQLGARGRFSGRQFNKAEAGGQIRHLTTDRIRVTDRGINVVEQHLARFGPDKPNQLMVARLRDVASGSLSPTQVDLNFYSHELREFVRYRRLGHPTGAGDSRRIWNNAHTATLEDYGLKGDIGDLYHPSTGLTE